MEAIGWDVVSRLRLASLYEVIANTYGSPQYKKMNKIWQIVQPSRPPTPCLSWELGEIY